MNPPSSMPALSPAEFNQEARQLALEIINQVLRPKEPVRTAVVLEALLLLYRFHAEHLPADTQGQCSMALASVAGDLLKASTSTSAPAGAPIH